jgi:hypothetical protein
MTAHDLLKKVKDDYDRLAEVSPPLPDESIAFFKATYKDSTIAKPEEANGLSAISIFKEPKLSIRIPISPEVPDPPKPVSRRTSVIEPGLVAIH